jgi:hypothetical protein
MKWGEKFAIRIQVFAVFMAVICPGFLIWMASTAKRQFDSYSWPSTSGTVQSTKATLYPGKRPKDAQFFGRVVYRYSVNGQTYTSDLTDLGPGRKRPDQQAALADVSHYHPGDEVTVYYDPHDPSVGVIEKGIPTIHLVLLVGLVIGTVVSWIASVFIVRAWLRSYRARRTSAPRETAGPTELPPT